MPVITARLERARNDLPPGHALQRLTQKVHGHRISFSDPPRGVEHNHPAGQKIDQVIETVGNFFLFNLSLTALFLEAGQLTAELRHLPLQHFVGGHQPLGQILKQVKALIARAIRFTCGARRRRTQTDHVSPCTGGGLLGNGRCTLSHGALPLSCYGFLARGHCLISVFARRVPIWFSFIIQ